MSFGLYRSAVVALVGESGSGKSTVARMLAGQERPTGGEILLDGAAGRSRGRRRIPRLKSDVQMVFQDPFASLNPVHTVRYRLSRPVRLHQLAKARGRPPPSSTRCSSACALTPTEQFVAKYPHELSGGQRQRVAIARALAVRPRVLLADEPVSMLDVSIRLGVLDLLDELRSQFELAILYVTHDIASARYFADETIVMYAGQIVERGLRRTSPSDRRTPTPSCCSPRRPTPRSSVESLAPAGVGSAAARGERPVEHRRLPFQRRAALSRRSMPRRVAAATAGSTRNAQPPAGGSTSPHQACSSRVRGEEEAIST